MGGYSPFVGRKIWASFQFIIRLMNIKLIKTTPFGSVGIVWAATDGVPKIVRVFLSKPGSSAEDQVSASYPNSGASSCAEMDNVTEHMKAFLEGENVKFSLNLITLELCSDFQQGVLRAEHEIPRGWVSTYRLIAKHLGKMHGARAVGNALAKNPFPLIVPCHRAIRSEGNLGGFQGGLNMKAALLEKEGILLDGRGRVVGAKYYYKEKIPS